MFDLSQVYIDAFHKIRMICRAEEYGVAIHGSGMHDLDLVAFPMNTNIKTSTALVERIIKAVGGQFVKGQDWPLIRPRGRECWLISLDEFHYIDFSVINGSKLQEL